MTGAGGLPGPPVLQSRLWDAVVVGAGPAGARTAFELSRLGKQVLLLDREVPDRWDGHILEACGAAHRSLIGRAQRLCRATSWALARPFLSRSLLRVLRHVPQLAEPLVRRVGAPLGSQD